MKEIKIRNAKLKLKKLVFVKGDSSIYIDSDIKSKLRFHEGTDQHFQEPRKYMESLERLNVLCLMIQPGY